MLFVTPKPASVAVRQGDVEALDACSSASLKTCRNELIGKGAVGGPGGGLDARAFIIVWRGMSVDLAFFRCARNAFGNLKDLGAFGEFVDILVLLLVAESTGLMISAAGWRKGGSCTAWVWWSV
jgi:hypothetical protein